MKKYALLASILGLTACGTTYHNGRTGLTIDDSEIELKMQADVKVDTSKKISGTAECTSNLWIFNSEPERQTYGIKMQTKSGNFAPSGCTYGAVYDALNNANADILVAPQYTTIHNGTLCFGTRCLHGTTKVLVSGYAGKITSITNK